MNTGNTYGSVSQVGAEQQILEHVKGALRVMVEWQAPEVSMDRKRESVRNALTSFCRHLERLMDYEEQDGYMSGVSDAKPNWHVRVMQLHDEHQALRSHIEKLAPQTRDILALDNERFEATCGEISQLLDEVDRHDRDEIALLQDTLLCDEGGEG